MCSFVLWYLVHFTPSNKTLNTHSHTTLMIACFFFYDALFCAPCKKLLKPLKKTWKVLQRDDRSSLTVDKNNTKIDLILNQNQSHSLGLPLSVWALNPAWTFNWSSSWVSAEVSDHERIYELHPDLPGPQLNAYTSLRGVTWILIRASCCVMSLWHPDRKKGA